MRCYRHFNNVVAAVFKQIVGFLDLREGEGMGYQRGRVNLPFGYKFQDFFAVATINATGLERQILAIHIRQR